MKDEPTLDSAGPVTIIAFLAIVTGIALGIALDAHQHWGDESGPEASTVAAAPEH